MWKRHHNKPVQMLQFSKKHKLYLCIRLQNIFLVSSSSPCEKGKFGASPKPKVAFSFPLIPVRPLCRFSWNQGPATATYSQKQSKMLLFRVYLLISICPNKINKYFFLLLIFQVSAQIVINLSVFGANLVKT